MPVLNTALNFPALALAAVGYDLTAAAVTYRLGIGGAEMPAGHNWQGTAEWVVPAGVSRVQVSVLIFAGTGAGGDVRGEFLVWWGHYTTEDYDTHTAGGVAATVAVTSERFTAGFGLTLDVAEGDVLSLLFARSGSSGLDTAGLLGLAGFLVEVI